MQPNFVTASRVFRLCGLALSLHCLIRLESRCSVAVGCLPSLHHIHQSLLYNRNRVTMTLPSDGAIPELPFCLRLRMDPGFVCCNNPVSETWNDVSDVAGAPVDAREQWHQHAAALPAGTALPEQGKSCSSVCLVAEAPLFSPCGHRSYCRP